MNVGGIDMKLKRDRKDSVSRWVDEDIYAVWQESHKRWALYKEKFGQLELSLYINCKRFACDQTLLEEYYNTNIHYDEF